MLEKRDIIDSSFNWEHYNKVYSARNAANKNAGRVIYPMFEDLYPEKGRVFNHVLEGRKIYDKEKNRYITVQSVHKHWYGGWYYMLLFYTEYEHLGKIEKSHGTLFFKNINCEKEAILNAIKRANERYEIGDVDMI